MSARSFAARPPVADTTVPEQATVDYTRDELADPGTADDMLAFHYDGQRTGYFNEYGEVRGIAAKDNTVAARFKRHSDEASANILECVDLSNAVLLAVDKDGKLVGAHVTPGAWSDVTFETGAAHASSGGYPHVSVRSEPVMGVVRLRGRMDISGAGFSSGVTSATIPAGFRPAATLNTIVRTSSAGALLVINTDGTLQVGTALSAGQWVALDGITWPLA